MMANDTSPRVARRVKVTIGLEPRAVEALEGVTAATGESKQSAINEAIRVHAWIRQMLDEGRRLHLVDDANGQAIEVKLF